MRNTLCIYISSSSLLLKRRCCVQRGPKITFCTIVNRDLAFHSLFLICHQRCAFFDITGSFFTQTLCLSWPSANEELDSVIWRAFASWVTSSRLDMNLCVVILASASKEIMLCVIKAFRQSCYCVPGCEARLNDFSFGCDLFKCNLLWGCRLLQLNKQFCWTDE